MKIALLIAMMMLSGGSTAPEYLYKIISEEQWEQSHEKVAPGAIDTDFIHLATEEQLPAIIHKFWKGQHPIILQVKTDELVGELIYESNPGGTTKYYHLYNGYIPIEAVKQIEHPAD